MRAHKYTAIN